MLSYNTRKWLFTVAFFSMTCVATMLILQMTTKSHSSTEYNQAIEIMPSFQVHIEWLHLSVVILYTEGLVSATATHIHWYFIPLAVFITIQLIYSTWLLLDRETYIQEQLELSWQAAYTETDNNSILENIQDQWQCQGFKTIFDRPAFVETLDNAVISPCYPILAQTFGSTVFIWGVGLWVVKLIQAIGLLACYALYIHINYTFVTTANGGIIIVEDMENNALIALPENDSDIESIDSDDDDDSTIVVLAAVSEEKLHLNSIEQNDCHSLAYLLFTTS